MLQNFKSLDASGRAVVAVFIAQLLIAGLLAFALL